MDKESNSNFT